jgi:hypothetical protein
MIYIDNLPLGVDCNKNDGDGEEEKKKSDTNLVLAVTGNPHIQQANSAFKGSHLSLSRSLPRTKKCISVLQNETASVEFEVDDAVLASDDATTCVIAVAVCRATGVASIAHFDELSSASDVCFRKFMSHVQHVGGRHCTYDAYLVGGMREETLVGYRTAGNLLRQMNACSPGKFNLRLCCVYDQNTCPQTGCSMARSFAFDPLTQTAYHVSTSTRNLGLASIHRNLSQKNLQDALENSSNNNNASDHWVFIGKMGSEGDKRETKEEEEEDCEVAVPAPLKRGKRSLSSGFRLDKLTAAVVSSSNTNPTTSGGEEQQDVHRGPGLDRRLAHFWLSGFGGGAEQQTVQDLQNVYDTWDQKFVLTGSTHAVPRWLVVNYAYLLTLGDKELLERTSTTPLFEGENYCSDVRLALNFILKQQANEAPSFTLYTQSFSWDPKGGCWMEVDKHTGKKMKHLQLQEDFNSIHLNQGGHHHRLGGSMGMGMGHDHLNKEPVVDVPGSSWSYTSLVDLEKEHLEAAAPGLS